MELHTLCIVEVSQKQSYIFSSKQLATNIQHSNHIRYVTSNDFFQKVAPEYYSEGENLVYAGGGHTILQFASQAQAVAFARCITAHTLRHYQGLELFCKQIPYDGTCSPEENLVALSAALEAKKSLRQASFRQLSFGVEALDSAQFQPQKATQSTAPDCNYDLTAPQGRRYATAFDQVVSGENFLAVVHIDGNAMGKRVQTIYAQAGDNWDACRQSLQSFSTGIQSDFETAFERMVARFIHCDDPLCQKTTLPIRPVILAGDDVCFITAGSIGLECARLYLEELTKLKNQQDGMVYAACGGVAMVHTKFPFHMAYDLSEHLCSSAKRFGSDYDGEGSISALDWHIEFGQLKDTLAHHRADFIAEDGAQLTLRPLLVHNPNNKAIARQYTYDYFRTLSGNIRGNALKIPRNKLKGLRVAMRQGDLESQVYIHNNSIRALYSETQHALDAPRALQSIFQNAQCLCFDAVELLDHYTILKEGTT